MGGAKIIGEVIEHTSEKTRVVKFKRRKRYRRNKGHRQHFTAVKIQQIVE
ncbi:MAG TPA: bL21 family ribosomal protein [Gemmatales bacterium]|nr:bL21 family ribosomal protein [Gemmatales bacterium]